MPHSCRKWVSRMPEVHAVLGASSAHRWMNCPGSVALNANAPDRSSTYADEGTLAHSLAENMINYNLGRMTKREFNKVFDTIKKNELYSQEMQDYIEGYVNTIWELMNEAKKTTPDAELLTEQRLDFSRYVPDGFGTGDVVIVCDGFVHVIDLKYGKGVGVSAEENPQLMLYGLGALAAYDLLYGIKTVKMTIIQPRLDIVSSYEVYAEDLEEWGENTVRPKAEAALLPDAPCSAGSWCQFCKVKATCRARAEANLELARFEFQDPRLLSDEEIGGILKRAGEVAAWAGDVKAYAQTEAVEHGKKWDGWKLVEGKSNRKYTDELAVAKALTTAGYDEAVLYERKLLGITAMEKLVGKKNFTELLGELVVKPAGAPTLVEATDKRPEINSAESAKEDFKDE